ncbi:MAG: 2-iminoacetate synthase ThiH [Chitinivibrionia bacterium]|nr:2-iminoacetate synthase ThiH [Chitinivibrionia bacterium]
MRTLEEEIDKFFAQKKTSETVEKVIELLDAKTCDLEVLALEARRLTRQYFGNTIKLFTPLYISNYCENGCAYCAFHRENKIARKQLDEREIHEQCRRIAQTGLRQILVLTGEAPKFCSFEYIKNSLEIISQYFSAISIEVYPMTTEQYKILVEEIGVDSVTMYQEAYDRNVYEKYHPFGKKKDYSWRINGLSRACEAGMRGVQLGALLGLGHPSNELAALSAHIEYLQKNFPETEVSVSFPRIRPIENGGGFNFFEISDKFYARIIAAFRVVFPSLPITLSTRETEKMRDGLLNFGVTKISAGVSTSVGEGGGSQFEIADERGVDEIAEYLTQNGFQAVFHDWNFNLVR